jgi:hypothetical protein
VRRIVLQRLLKDPSWEQLDDDNAKSFEGFLTFDPPRPDDREVFGRCLLDVFWQLVAEGVLSPGKGLGSMGNLPWFHRTAYGARVIAIGEYIPHDPVDFLSRLDRKVPSSDPTVRAYLAESLTTFLHGNLLASMVMLGVAAERVFDLVCETLEPALADASERAQLNKLLRQMSVRKRLDWVHAKLRNIEDTKRPTGYPDRASVMVIAIYELMRAQRNDLGHPREDPPRPSRDDAYAHLQIFPTYYATAELLRSFLKSNQV